MSLRSGTQKYGLPKDEWFSDGGYTRNLFVEEEIERDEEERLGDLEIIAVREKANKVAELEAKLADDSITFKQLKELMRLRR